MRNTFKILTILFILSGCKSEDNTSYAILSGEIKNLKETQLILKNNFWEPIDTIQLTNQKFRDTLAIPNSYYYLSNGNTEIKIYLNSGMDLKLNLDTEDVINSTIWKGKGQKENNYLVSKAKLTESIPIEKRGYSEYAKLDEKNFLSQTDSIHKTYLFHFQNTKNLDETFSYLEKNSINIENGVRISQYESMKKMVDQNSEFKVSENYPNPYTNIDMNNAQLMNTYRYKDLMNNYVSLLVTNSENYSGTSDFFFLYLKQLAKLNLDSSIRDKLGLESAEYGFTYTKDKEIYYQEYISFAKIDVYKTKFEEKYNVIKMEKGNPSPNFKLIGLNGDYYTLDYFKGKYTYIDLWASWCSPCIAQIPHLKKLEEKYSNKINFVSIAWNDNKQNWKNMISKQNLKGIQLFAPIKDSEFFKFYNVTAIPRFILLDKDGKIIESTAKQPSEKSLDKQMNNLE